MDLGASLLSTNRGHIHVHFFRSIFRYLPHFQLCYLKISVIDNISEIEQEVSVQQGMY